jgi:WD40 repeat protein
VPNSQNEIVIFDLKNGSKEQPLIGHCQKITSMSVEQDGRFVASFSYQDKNLKIWK